MKRRILVATTNPGKLTELSELLGAVSEKIEWVSLKSYPNIPEVIEDGDSFAENARKKALGYARVTDLWTIADDSGLVIDALGGRPGIYSARYAADECDGDREVIDTANYKKVLTELQDTAETERTARFICRLCLVSPERVLLETEGSIEGVINRGPIGKKGFGYDPIFYIPSLDKTAAQLDSQEKNRISHRGNAIGKLRPLLEDLLI